MRHEGDDDPDILGSIRHYEEIHFATRNYSLPRTRRRIHADFTSPFVNPLYSPNLLINIARGETAERERNCSIHRVAESDLRFRLPSDRNNSMS